MTLSQTVFSPFLRTLAAGTLLVWLSAHALCAHLCSTAGDAAGARSSCCHANGGADSHRHHNNAPMPSQHGPCGSASCLTLQTALLGSKVATLPPPHLVPLYTLPTFVL